MPASPTPVDFTAGAPAAVSLPVSWLPPRGVLAPPLRTQWADPHTVVLRQSLDVDYEAPFLFLLFGYERALLVDTGATADPTRLPLRTTVDELIAQWLTRHPREGNELVVAHSHAHGDHIAGDGQFADRERTVVVGTGLEAVVDHFGLGAAGGPVPFDLGGQIVEVLATPGHHPTAVTFSDPWTGWLLTGDTVYPGRLYVADMPAFRDTLDRLVGHAADRRCTAVLGCHIEMSRTPGRDHPLGSTHHRDEPPLQLPVGVLAEIRDAAAAVADRPGIHRFDRFVIVHGSGRTVRARLRGRALLARLRSPRPRS